MAKILLTVALILSEDGPASHSLDLKQDRGAFDTYLSEDVVPA